MILPRLLSRRFALALSILLTSICCAAIHAQTFTDIVVFGDSLSDTGNIAHRTESEFGVRYPSFISDVSNYTDGRFTDGPDTDPAARQLTGVWHEQLAKYFLKIKPATNSLDGGLDYAFGGAKTIAGATNRSLFSDPTTGINLSLTIDDMGKQVGDYLAAHTPSASELFIVWGGGNDLFDDPSSTDVTTASTNMGGLITQLAQAGARTFLVPNVPPLGMVPNYKNDATKAAALNTASSAYRDALNTVLDQVTASLAAQNITVTIYRLDVYSLFLNFVANPAPYGFDNATDSSQGASVNPDKSLFWDTIHPTTNGHFFLAAQAYSLISGQPVVATTAPVSGTTENGAVVSFYLTRIGDDLSTKLLIPYTVAGSAKPDIDYVTLKGFKSIKPGKNFVKVNLQTLDNPASKANSKVTLTVGTGTGYSIGGLTNTSLSILNTDPKQ